MNKLGRNACFKIFWMPMATYVVVLIISAVFINISPTSAWWRIPLALIPVVPAAFSMFAYMRFIRRMDELQRHIHLEGLAFSFAGVGFLTLSYGFLENIGFPHVSWVYIFPLMLVFWSIGSAFAGLRYR